MLKLYKMDNNGEIVIQTDCLEKAAFVSELAEALHRLAIHPTEGSDIVHNFEGSSLMENAAELLLKIGGYKAERVYEQRLLTCGWGLPGDVAVPIVVVNVNEREPTRNAGKADA
tara:strand:+ start:560 stop:901 length:342 start_codon:yes stop_codon:yes gene_type:complete